MEEKYEITISIRAKEDLKLLIFYIKNDLKEPIIAKNYSKKIREEINTLSYFPQRNAIINEDNIQDLKIRKLIIKKYIAFYRVNEEKKIVTIERILYGTSNWTENL